MKTETLVVKCYAVISVLFALPAFLMPELFAQILKYNIDLPAAKMEFVAAYGGLILGLGVFLMVCAKENVRLGLIAILCIVGTLFVGRVIGYLLDVESTPVQNSFLLIEFLTVLFMVKLLSRHRNKQAQPVTSV
ncbi:DUF4345 family protein [Alkalimarinus coralli]|uniref:DUF4345 family protein n=1 Tax=Alkalimarinus coralli TaxID=2935863 RepID=UPI00202B5C25|nr:DUF4345 family protein [Alkalimarinus coralli]